MRDRKRCACSKIKFVTTVVMAAAAGFALSHFVFPTAVPPEVPPCIEKLFKTHKLFQYCKPDTRELAFLEKGGEYFPDYKNPRTFNDKIAYILHNYYHKSPITWHIGNKYMAKEYVAQAVGEEHVVKLLGVWDNPSDIKWDDLPNRFVLKTARGHLGKQVIVVKDKNKLDITATIKQLEEFCKIAGMGCVKTNRVIAEEYLESSDGEKAVRDYKFFGSYGKVLFAYCLEASSGDTCDVDTKSSSYYSVPDWKKLPFKVGYHEQNDVPKPKHFDRMIALVEKLSESLPLIRVDLYEVGDRVLVGELTEDACGAKYIFSPLVWDFKLGEMFNVPTLEELNKIIENDKKKYGNEGVGNW
ncbi:hypothetical protein FACS1894122_00840 [Alphaproteobacteria bacterium]|nr:hypothetical protein FACS1894122_00840 [Alphaproteobacteria bacterium]